MKTIIRPKKAMEVRKYRMSGIVVGYGWLLSLRTTAEAEESRDKQTLEKQNDEHERH
jgi:hypothetical protein